MNGKTNTNPQPWTTFLCTWFSPVRGDHFTTSADNPQWAPHFEDPGLSEQLPEIGTMRDLKNRYELVRVEGRIFSSTCPQPPNTVPLYNYWDGKNKNNILTTEPSLPGKRRLKWFRHEGYIYKDPSSKPIVLKSPKGEEVHDPLPRRALRQHHNTREGDDLTTSATGKELAYLVLGLRGSYDPEGDVLGYLLPDINETIPLNIWHCPEAQDFYTNSLWLGNTGDRKELFFTFNRPALTYELVQEAGMVYNPHFPQPPGTLPLWSFWNLQQRKHLLSTSKKADLIRNKRNPGFQRVRLEGFVLDSQRWAGLPLTSFHNARTRGHATVVVRPDEPSVLGSGWTEDRTEGFVFRTGTPVPLHNITAPLLPRNLVEGDREFGGHGPAILARLRVYNTDSEVRAVISFEAWEYPFGGPHDTPRRKSHTLQSWDKPLFTAPAGHRIRAITSCRTSEVLFASPPGGTQFGVDHREFVDIADVLSNISEVVDSVVQLGGSEYAKAISRESDATFRLFAEGFKVLKFGKGEKLRPVRPRYAGPVSFFAIVGDTAGIDIARHENPHGNTRIAGIDMSAIDVVMD